MRFPEFDGEWTSDIFINLVNKRNEKINPTKLNYKDDYKCIELDSLSQETGELLTTYSVEEQKSIKNLFYKNDILYSKLRPYLRKYYKTNFDGCCSSEIWVLNSNILNHDFLYQYIQTNKFNQIANISTGSKMPRADWSIISEIELFYPTNEEMNKIGHFFKLLDERIIAQSKIINAYESLINSISSSLFEKIGARTKLSEICVINKGQQINGVDLLENGLYYMMNGGTSPSGYLNIYNKEANTISISEGGNSCGYVQFNLKKFWSGGHCYTIENLKPTIKNKFLYYYLKFNESKIMNLRIGTGLPNIQKRDLEQFMVTIPNIENQIQITNILDCIETKLNKEKKLLTLYQSQKNYLLKNMFV